VAVRKCIVSGYFSHAAKLGHDGMYHTLRGGGVTVSPHPTSVVARFGAPPEWVIYNEVHVGNATTLLREVTKIDPKWLAELAPHYFNIKY
jgi:ATP-dependent RNA helicase DDX35